MYSMGSNIYDIIHYQYNNIDDICDKSGLDITDREQQSYGDFNDLDSCDKRIYFQCRSIGYMNDCDMVHLYQIRKICGISDKELIRILNKLILLKILVIPDMNHRGRMRINY